MDTQGPFFGVAVLPGPASQGKPSTPLPTTPPRSKASPRLKPRSAHTRRASCHAHQDGRERPLSPCDALIPVDGNYTFDPPFQTLTARASLNPSSSGVHTARQTGFSYAWHGRPDDGIPRHRIVSLAEGCGTAPLRPSPLECLDSTTTRTSTSSAGSWNVSLLEEAVSKIRLGEYAEVRNAQLSESGRNSVPPTAGLHDACRHEDPTVSITSVPCHRLPATSFADNPSESPAVSRVNNNEDNTEESPTDDDDDGEGEEDYEWQDHGVNDNDREEDDEEDQSDAEDTKTSSKAGRVLSGYLGCPYRRRNPGYFNVRHFSKCAKPFKDLSSVKSVHA